MSLELGPRLRLLYLEGPEGHKGYAARQHRVLPGSITIASEQIREDYDVPKGFYLRRINGVLWLTGYRAGPENVWHPADHFVLAVSPSDWWPFPHVTEWFI